MTKLTNAKPVDMSASDDDFDTIVQMTSAKKTAKNAKAAKPAAKKIAVKAKAAKPATKATAAKKTAKPAKRAHVSANAKQVAIQNVQIRPDLAQRVRFVRRTRANGEVLNLVRTRGLPKLVIRRVSEKEVVGHLSGQRKDIKATSTSERATFLKLVESVWNGKAAKQAWHPK